VVDRKAQTQNAPTSVSGLDEERVSRREREPPAERWPADPGRWGGGCCCCWAAAAWGLDSCSSFSCKGSGKDFHLVVLSNPLIGC
jgi:hypothetical protein